MTELSGRRNKACYYVLCLAVEAARGCLPEEPAMKMVCANIRQSTGMTAAAAAKALSQATADIWEYGNRDKLQEVYGRPLYERPSPKELVCVLANYCWAGERRPQNQSVLSSSVSF